MLTLSSSRWLQLEQRGAETTAEQQSAIRAIEMSSASSRWFRILLGRPVEHAAGPRGGHLAVFERHLPVDDDHGDSLGVTDAASRTWPYRERWRDRRSSMSAFIPVRRTPRSLRPSALRRQRRHLLHGRLRAGAASSRGRRRRARARRCRSCAGAEASRPKTGTSPSDAIIVAG